MPDNHKEIYNIRVFVDKGKMGELIEFSASNLPRILNAVTKASILNQRCEITIYHGCGVYQKSLLSCKQAKELMEKLVDLLVTYRIFKK